MFEYPFIADYLLLKLHNDKQLHSLEKLKENQNVRVDLNEQCLADLVEHNLINEIKMDEVSFYQINENGRHFVKKAVELHLTKLNEEMKD